MNHFRNRHEGAPFLILGGGVSINDYTVDELKGGGDRIIIGVNQIARKMDPDYVTLVDPPLSLMKQAGLGAPRHSLESSQCFVSNEWHSKWRSMSVNVRHAYPLETFWWYLKELSRHWADYEPTDYATLRYDWWDKCPKIRLPHAPTSVGMAVLLAIYMGASKVGILGLDYTLGYFWNPRKVFAKTKHGLKQSRGQWERFRLLAQHTFDVDIVNLSKWSRITTLPYFTFEEFYG